MSHAFAIPDRVPLIGQTDDKPEAQRGHVSEVFELLAARPGEDSGQVRTQGLLLSPARALRLASPYSFCQESVTCPESLASQ